jgi:spore coat assembly protein
MIKIGDYVSRNSYNNDIIFEVVSINGDNYILRGIDFRLIADSKEDDLVLVDKATFKCNDDFARDIFEDRSLNRDDYFYLPGKILHIDGDSEYLKRCMEFYEKAGVLAYGKKIKESDMPEMVQKYINQVKPDVLVITGHDAYYKKRAENKEYKNSNNFIEAVKEARKVSKSPEELIIIAGACQSNYEELIKAGSTFASSPKRINIHALDPAIVATSISLSDRNQEINLIKIISKTRYGKDGIGGLKSKGTMFVGYPRNQE